MFAVTVEIQITGDRMAEFLPLMLENARASQANEPACHRFDVLTDGEQPGMVFLYELYADAAGFEAHREMPHFKQFDTATKDMIAAKRLHTWDTVQG